ncbi:ATP-binding cassette domain-containing protein [Verticiella sediminum]|uniref:ATP-binding cassette domain-containing protein n=1 Tax=Verticiella sediminum TaxID=1247510 RepID=A0A556AIK7_9BURK|nr:ATP-binding cassette domain-containing protein [Verticiella sediminum]TSH92710.1 ATP-binding cassette domain-containing protein [Verticiella sediminum]
MSTLASPLLDVRGVTVRFGGLTALDAVSFEVRQGEILALIGPNGAGKSTMIGVVSGARAPDTGSVRFAGEDVSVRNAAQRSRLGIARTFQSAEVLRSLSVLENVMAAAYARHGSGFVAGLLGARSAHGSAARMRELALAQLELVGLTALAAQPAGLLTAGQQRLLAVARGLATEARLLILDEPAAGLNATEKHTLSRLIQQIRGRGTTIMFVEHDLAFVGRLADRMVVLDHGRLLAQGEPDEVRADPAVVAAYLGNTEVSVNREPAPAAAPARLLSVDAASVRYGGLTALERLDLWVGEREIVSLVGANGAGKTSLLNAVAGLAPLAEGSIRLAGRDLAGIPAQDRSGLGIALAPEGRGLFPTLTVRDNLMLGRYALVRRAGVRHLLRPVGDSARQMREVLDEVLGFFPRLAERIDQQAGTLSGGEGQMLAIGRALMSRPRLLLLDEPSFGLAPQVTREILEFLPTLTRLGLSILLVEQNARAALQVSHRGYVLANGRLTDTGPAAELLSRGDIGAAYLGMREEAEVPA